MVGRSNAVIRFYVGDVGGDPVVDGSEEDGFAPSFRLPSLRVSVGSDGENDDGAVVGAAVYCGRYFCARRVRT